MVRPIRKMAQARKISTRVFALHLGCGLIVAGKVSAGARGVSVLKCTVFVNAVLCSPQRDVASPACVGLRVHFGNDHAPHLQIVLKAGLGSLVGFHGDSLRGGLAHIALWDILGHGVLAGRKVRDGDSAVHSAGDGSV